MSKPKDFLEAYIAPALNPEKTFCVGQVLYYSLKAPCVLRICLDTNYEDTEVKGFRLQLIHKLNGELDSLYFSFKNDLGLDRYNLRRDCWVNAMLFDRRTVANGHIRPFINRYLKVWGLFEEE